MNNGRLFLLITVFLLCCLAAVTGQDVSGIGAGFPRKQYSYLPFPYRFLVDQVSAAYRTGTIDPAIDQIPRSIQQEALSSPSTGIPRLAEFLYRDGGKSGAARDAYHYVKRVHDWMTGNVAYDDNLLHGTSGHQGSRDPEEQLSEGGLDRVYQVRLKGPPGAEMRCFLIETDSSGDYREHPDGSSVKPGQHYTSHYDGETYTFLFSPGDPLHSGSRYRARIQHRECR